MPFGPMKKGEERRVVIVLKGPRDVDAQNKLHKALRDLQKKHPNVHVPKVRKD